MTVTHALNTVVIPIMKDIMGSVDRTTKDTRITVVIEGGISFWYKGLVLMILDVLPVTRYSDRLAFFGIVKDL